MINKLWIGICILILTACSDWPPAVSTSRAIKSLPATTTAIRGIGISDNEVFDIVERFVDLDYVYLNSTSNITDKGISSMKRLKRLRQLVLENSSLITDESLKSFRSYPALREIILKDAIQLSGRGLQNLTDLKNLQLLYVSNAPKIKPSDLDELRKSLPHCTIKDITGN